MDLIQLTDHAYHLKGGSNAGLIVQDGRAILVDTGLDKDTAKKILRHIDALKVDLAAVVITHAHADHFGGAATIRARTGAAIYAPALEAAIVENPILEPLYLFSGALPPAELKHKFTLADACSVDSLMGTGEVVIAGVPVEVLSAPGHAPNQVMIAGGGACFVADAVFAPDILAKHGIPFMVDLDAWLETLAALPQLDGRYAAFAPGHGASVSSIAPWAGLNIGRLREIQRAVESALADTDDPGQIVSRAATGLGITIANPVTYWLAQTAVFACLASLQRAGKTQPLIEYNSLCWRPA